jgi:lipoprotein-anchoring transpeptidase ErfK/SrfK
LPVGLWLNFRVSRDLQHRFARARRNARAGGIWRGILLLAVIALIVGIWWWRKPAPRPVRSARPAAPVKAAPKPITLSRQAPGDFPRPARGVLEAQVALARRAISPGPIDAALGSQTRAAISVFQRVQNLFPTGQLDTNTQAELMLGAPVLTSYVVTTNDLGRLQPLGKTWLAKSQQSALEYETVLELVAEKSHSHPELIRRLNPGVSWTNLAPGAVLRIPAVAYPAPADTAAFAVIHLSGKYLEAFDAQTNLLAHFPCSIAQNVEKRPVGELHVVVVAPDPNYTFDPEVFPESPEAQQLQIKLILQPGPNNPVGVAWIGLDKTGYGIHGTPNPEQVGRTESHGCFRLANWDAEYLEKLVWPGMPVWVEP